MRSDEIQRLRFVSHVLPLPDGRIVACVEHADAESDRNLSALRVLDPATGVARPLTLGPEDREPVLAPDGERIAFLRRDEPGRSQAWVIPVAGGEALPLAELPLGVLGLAWAPDGRRLVVTARRPEAGRYGTDPDVGPRAERPRRITTARWRTEGTGYLHDRPASLAILEVPDASDLLDTPRGTPVWRWVDAPPAEWTHARWCRDGSAILAIADAHASRDEDLRRDVWLVAESGAAEPLTAAHGNLEALAFAELADGALVVSVRDMGPEGRDYAGAAAALLLLDQGRSRLLTDAEVDDIGAVGAVTAAGARAVAARVRRRGRTELIHVDVDSAEQTPLAVGEITVTAHASTEDGDIVWGATTVERSGVVGIGRGDAGIPISDDPPVHAVRELVAIAHDGHPVHGWVALPAGDGPHPVVLTVHGGPYAQYGAQLADELQVLVSAGYAVVQCNPRGSAGYGRAHARAIRGRLGTDDQADVLAFLDHALADDPRLDADRVGIMGGSYGGYLTAWIIAHTHRFRGAIVERGWFDPAVFTGTSDIGSFYADEYVGVDDAAIARQSPQAVAAQVATPTLVIHSEEDLRCPIGQSERYYTTLRRSGVETEFVIFPGEGHELTRSGRPRHRIERFDLVLDWWARHLSINGSQVHMMSLPADAEAIHEIGSAEAPQDVGIARI